MADSTEGTPVRRRRHTARAPEVDSLPDLQLRATDPAICPFFRSVAADGALALPIGRPDDANRCAAFGEPWPQSQRQQELVCLTTAHTGCPRYLRGSQVAAEAGRRRDRRGMTTAILASIMLLVATMAAAIAFVLARGGIELPPPAPTGVAGLPSPTIISVPTAMPSATAPTTSQPSRAPSASPTPAPTPTATPTAVPTPSPNATSDRYALLEPCPDTPDCWIYTARSGDNLTSIANYFGIPLAVVYQLNPELQTQSLQPGKQIILPPPTR